MFLLCRSLVSGCASGTSALTDKVDLPGLWLSEDPDVLRSSRTLQPGGVGMELHEDGTAQAFNPACRQGAQGGLLLVLRPLGRHVLR